MSLLRRHRAVRDVPEGDVITQTEPEIDAEGGTESTVGKTDQPTGENPTPDPETVVDPEAEDDGEDAEAGEEPADEDDEGLAVVVTADGIEHVGILPASAAVPPAADTETETERQAEEQPEDEPADDEPQPEPKPRKRTAR